MSLLPTASDSVASGSTYPMSPGGYYSHTNDDEDNHHTHHPFHHHHHHPNTNHHHTNFVDYYLSQSVSDDSQNSLIVEDTVMDRGRWIVTILVSIISMGAVITALTALYLHTVLVTMVAFVFPLILGPYALHQRRQINKLPSYLYEIHQCRRHVHRLGLQNVRLAAASTKLETQVAQLAPINDEFVKSAKHLPLNELRMLIYENGNLQRQVTQLLHTRDLQHLLTRLLVVDPQQTQHPSPPNSHDLDQVMGRFKALSEGPIPEEELRHVLWSMGGGSTVMPRSGTWTDAWKAARCFI